MTNSKSDKKNEGKGHASPSNERQKFSSPGRPHVDNKGKIINAVRETSQSRTTNRSEKIY